MVEEASPFIKLLNPKIESMKEGNLVMKMPFQPAFIGNPKLPCLHGGVLAALIDHCAGFCSWSCLDEGKALSTVDLRVDYLRPG